MQCGAPCGLRPRLVPPGRSLAGRDELGENGFRRASQLFELLLRQMIDDQSADVTGLMIAARVINLWIPGFLDVSKSRLQICRTVAVTIGILQSKLGPYKKTGCAAGLRACCARAAACRFSKCVSFSGRLTWGDGARLMLCHLQSVSDACHFPR